MSSVSNGLDFAGTDEPPPKPARIPMAGTDCGLLGSHALASPPSSLGPIYAPAQVSIDGGQSEGPTPTTYIVAQNPKVLSKLMKENKDSNTPGLYTAPASAFNIVAVDLKDGGDAPQAVPGDASNPATNSESSSATSNTLPHNLGSHSPSQTGTGRSPGYSSLPHSSSYSLPHSPTSSGSRMSPRRRGKGLEKGLSTPHAPFSPPSTLMKVGIAVLMVQFLSF